MSRDYKHVPKQKDKSADGPLGAVLTFVTGLALGLFVAFFIYLNQSDSSYTPLNLWSQSNSEPDTIEEEKNSENITLSEEDELPKPKFDFYNILPNKEINISEWVAEEQSLPGADSQDENSVFILQVGSFKQMEAADQIKAQLALLGISADIQRVVINGQDTRYRVRIGPYADQNKLNEERRRLQDNNLEFMLLKLQADDPRLGEG